MPPDTAALLNLLDAHWVIHLAWPDPQVQMPPHCTPLYYARLCPSKECASVPPNLIFFSDPQTLHGQRHREHLAVGASIALETPNLSQIRGATLRGHVRHADALPSLTQKQAREQYLARHPNAEPFLRSKAAHLYLFSIDWAKLTDNQRGFGQHLEFEFPAANLT